MNKSKTSKKSSKNKSSKGSVKSDYSFFKSKKFIRLFSIIIISVILLSILFSFLSIHVKLLFETETRISLTPLTASFNTVGGQDVPVTFDVDVSKLRLCDVSCNHILVDSSYGVVVSNITVDSLKHQSFSYNLSPPDFGSGQVIYNYQLTCQNKYTSLCPSKGKNYSKSAFITVDYDLSDEDVLLKYSVLSSVSNLINESESLSNILLDLKNKLSSLDYYNSSFDLEKELSHNVSKHIDELGDINSIVFTDLFSAIEVENYLLANSIYQNSSLALSSLNNSIYSLKDSVDDLYFNFQNDLNTLDSIFSSSKNYSSMVYFFNSTNSSYYYESLDLVNLFNSLINSLDDKSFYLFSTFSFDVNYLSSGLSSLYEQYLSLVSKSTTDGIDLFNSYNSTYNLVSNNSFVLENSICDSLEDVSSRVFSYNLGVDLSGLNSSQKDYYTSYSISLLNNNSLNNISNNVYFTFPTSDLDTYLSSYCNLPSSNLFSDDVVDLNLSYYFNHVSLNKNFPSSKGSCCFEGDCSACCTDDTCKNNYPIILVHGHSFSKSTSPELSFTRLSSLQNFLSADGYINGGIIGQNSLIENISDGTWGRNSHPLVVGVTYYYLNYYDLGNVNFVTRKTDNIENYALRLRESVDLVLRKTNQEKVILIAHSMGGLVAREYISLFGEDNVDTLIILGSPNYGVEGDVDKYCTVTGAKAECNDMSSGSIFLTRLNSQKNYLSQTKTYTIAAVGCDMKSDVSKSEPGDGVVLARNVPLPFSTNYNVSGNCTDFMQTDLHMNFVNPSLYPQTYDIIKGILID